MKIVLPSHKNFSEQSLISLNVLENAIQSKNSIVEPSSKVLTTQKIPWKTLSFLNESLNRLKRLVQQVSLWRIHSLGNFMIDQGCTTKHGESTENFFSTLCDDGTGIIRGHAHLFERNRFGHDSIAQCVDVNANDGEVGRDHFIIDIGNHDDVVGLIVDARNIHAVGVADVDFKHWELEGVKFRHLGFEIVPLLNQKLLVLLDLLQSCANFDEEFGTIKEGESITVEFLHSVKVGLDDRIQSASPAKFCGKRFGDMPAGSGDALKCGALSSAGINTTTKVVIGTCASWATEPELCDVFVVSVDRIVSLGFNLFFSFYQKLVGVLNVWFYFFAH